MLWWRLARVFCSKLSPPKRITTSDINIYIYVRMYISTYTILAQSGQVCFGRVSSKGEPGFGANGSIHVGAIEPDICPGMGRTERWPSPTSFHDKLNPRLFVAFQIHKA